MQIDNHLKPNPYSIMQINFIAVLVAALLPMLIGSIYYNPSVLGKQWMQSSGVTELLLKQGNMILILGSSFLFSLFLAMSMNTLVIHQMGFMQTLQSVEGINDASSDIGKYAADFFSKHGNNFRTFKHGALHGAISALFLVLPLIGITALFERRSFKYIFIHLGYWLLTFMLMGGLICAWK